MVAPRIEDKQTYDIRELFSELTCSLSELARISELNEVTLARIRDGHVARRDTMNRLLVALSKVYERPLSLRNVTGIRLVGQEQESEQAA
jgi:predicted transcriptional regulator